MLSLRDALFAPAFYPFFDLLDVVRGEDFQLIIWSSLIQWMSREMTWSLSQAWVAVISLDEFSEKTYLWETFKLFLKLLSGAFQSFLLENVLIFMVLLPGINLKPSRRSFTANKLCAISWFKVKSVKVRLLRRNQLTFHTKTAQICTKVTGSTETVEVR